MTDINPGWHPQGRSMFDVGRVSQMDAQTINDRLALFMGTLLQAAAGTCTRPLCKVRPHLLGGPSRLMPVTMRGWGAWPKRADSSGRSAARKHATLCGHACRGHEACL